MENISKTFWRVWNSFSPNPFKCWWFWLKKKNKSRKRGYWSYVEKWSYSNS